MRKIVILGAGTAGTALLRKLHRILPASRWELTIIDEAEEHFYQPGFLYLPFGMYSVDQIRRPLKRFLPAGVRHVRASVDRIEADRNRVLLTEGTIVPYDFLVIATGCRIAPEQTEGMQGEQWRTSVFDFYTAEGATALARALSGWQGGRLVVHVTEMPIKCPVAPLEFAFLADWYFTVRGIRNRVDIRYVTPLPGAFTRPIASERLGHLLRSRNIELVPEFSAARVDGARRSIVAWDDTEVPFDLLVTIPTNMGDGAIARSGLGDELQFVPTDRATLRSDASPNIFVMGDATNLPASKAGSVAHFQTPVVIENLLASADERPLDARFDGHANCFVETGFGKGILIDFNYETEPLPGTYPLPWGGPFSLLAESRVNHWGKLAFRWIYWNVLLRGLDLPVPAAMSMAGKRRPSS